MAKKRKTLPKEIKTLLEQGDIEGAKALFLKCEPNAVIGGKYGSNIFSLTPLPREFAFWAKDQGADVNFRDYYEVTPIFNHASFWNGDTRLLIDLGADIHVARHDGTTPFHLAALYGRVEAVKALLEAGADVNRKTGRIDWPGYLTPLEKTLEQSRLPYPLLLEVCTILLDHGAQITDRCREYLKRSAERFQRNKRGIKDLAFLQSQTENLDKLLVLFGVELPREVPFHDGVSPIRLPKGEGNPFAWLWDYLVPPSGKAPTAQGEVIRIAGRVNHEIMGNGGMNWDRDYRMMLRAFPDHLRLGKPLGEQEIAKAEETVRLLRDGRDSGNLSVSLGDYAVAWILQNPTPLPPLAGDYDR